MPIFLLLCFLFSSFFSLSLFDALIVGALFKNKWTHIFLISQTVVIRSSIPQILVFIFACTNFAENGLMGLLSKRFLFKSIKSIRRMIGFLVPYSLIR